MAHLRGLIAAMVWMIALLGLSGQAHALVVKITPEIEEVTIQHGSEMVRVLRNQNQNAVIPPDFAKTSRPCPPYCIQPEIIAPGVVTVGEVEVIQFMSTRLNVGNGLLIDARTPNWYAQGTIPGSVNIPYTDLNPELGAKEKAIAKALQRFGVSKTEEGQWDFTHALELLLWCNGPWCRQSVDAILGLLELGYPAEKIRYYRGGMQMWRLFGLPVVAPPRE